MPIYKRPDEEPPLSGMQVVVVGIVVFILLGAFAPGALAFLFFGGIITAIIWFFVKEGQKSADAKAVWLRPRATELPFSSQAVFSKIREVLRESVYGHGLKWKVTTADVRSNRIFAEMHLQEGEYKGYVSLDVRIEDLPSGHSLLRYVFDDLYSGYLGSGKSTTDIIRETEAELLAGLKHIVDDESGSDYVIG